MDALNSVGWEQSGQKLSSRFRLLPSGVCQGLPADHRSTDLNISQHLNIRFYQVLVADQTVSPASPAQLLGC